MILCLTTLEERRKRGDLIQMYKIAKGLDIVEWDEEIEFRNIRRDDDLSFNREAFKSRNRNDFAHFEVSDIIFSQIGCPKSGINYEER